ncbi:MAG: VOC family protein [Gammaproteobacteria bacterium]|jgi:lactoylglutathione lyase
MEIKRLDHVGIRVMDFTRSVQFYRKLGFQVIREDFKEGVVVLKHPAGVELNLLDSGNDNHGNKNVLMDVKSNYPGYTHYALEVSSVKRAKDFLEQINVNITEGPVTFGDGKTSIFVRDPDLNVLEFTELPKT